MNHLASSKAPAPAGRSFFRFALLRERIVMSRHVNQAQGVLEISPKGFGFLRNSARNYVAQSGDAYVGGPLIQKYRLQEGMLLAGPVEPSRKGTGPRLLDVMQLEGMQPAAYPRRKFDDLTPIDPREQIRLETGPEPLTTRVMDLLTPIGKGQRGLIV